MDDYMISLLRMIDQDDTITMMKNGDSNNNHIV